MIRRAILALLFLVPGVTVAAGANPALDPRVLESAVRRIATLVEENYVDQAQGGRLAAGLLRSLDDGEFTAYGDPRDLATALTGVLRPHDRHFLVSWSSPDQAPVDDHHDPAARAQWNEISRLGNFGFRSLATLPGNIGYLDLRYFDSVDIARPTAEAAMAFLANSDAVIVDLRENGGGEPAMVQLLCSYFFGPEPVHLNSLYWRPGNHTEEFWTLEYLPGRRLPDVPLYVLTSRRTGSAAEEFAYNVQSRKRGLVLGQVTAGAANPGDVFDAGNGFSIFISTGKAINPVTSTNWEGVGVVPDVAISSDAALDEAQLHALDRLRGEAMGPVRIRVLDWARDAIQAGRTPYPVSRSKLREYTGQYGNRNVRLEDGHLMYQRGDRPARAMIALDADLFLLKGVDGFRTRFERNQRGRIERMVDAWVEGHEEANTRQ